MISAKDREGVFANVVRLRRAERESPGNREISSVRLDLEAMLGETVAPAFAARVLGISHTALKRWIDRGRVPVVIGVDGRRGVPVHSLVDLHEGIERERAAGKKHALESAVHEERSRAERLQPRGLLWDGDSIDAEGRTAELRSLAYHRAIARRLDRRTAAMALALVRYWRDSGSIDPRYAEQWEGILEGPLAGTRKALEDEGPRGRDLRQNSPFAGLLSETERRKIVAEIG